MPQLPHYNGFGVVGPTAWLAQPFTNQVDQQAYAISRFLINPLLTCNPLTDEITFHQATLGLRCLGLHKTIGFDRQSRIF